MNEQCKNWLLSQGYDEGHGICECTKDPYLYHCNHCGALIEDYDPWPPLEDRFCSDCWKDEQVKRLNKELDEIKQIKQQLEAKNVLLSRIFDLVAGKHGEGRNGCALCEAVAAVYENMPPPECLHHGATPNK